MTVSFLLVFIPCTLWARPIDIRPYIDTFIAPSMKVGCLEPDGHVWVGGNIHILTAKVRISDFETLHTIITVEENGKPIHEYRGTFGLTNSFEGRPDTGIPRVVGDMIDGKKTEPFIMWTSLNGDDLNITLPPEQITMYEKWNGPKYDCRAPNQLVIIARRMGVPPEPCRF